MATLAVDEDQGLVGAETAKRSGTQRVRAVGNRRLREVEGRNELVEDLVRFGLAGVGNRLGADDVDRDRAVRDRPVRTAGAGDDDGLLVGIIGRGLGRSLSGGLVFLGQAGAARAIGLNEAKSNVRAANFI